MKASEKVWYRRVEGSYGYIHYYPSEIVKTGKKKCQIKIQLIEGGSKTIWVNADNLFKEHPVSGKSL